MDDAGRKACAECIIVDKTVIDANDELIELIMACLKRSCAWIEGKGSLLYALCLCRIPTFFFLLDNLEGSTCR